MGAEVSARQGALEKGLFSIQGGWAAVVTKLGEGGGFKEERSLKGRSGRGGCLPLPPAGEWAGQPKGCWDLREAGGEEAEGLTLVGGQRRPVAVEVPRDAAAGGSRTVTQGLDASLSLEFCKTGGRARPGQGAFSGAGGGACALGRLPAMRHHAGSTDILLRWELEVAAWV